MIDVQQPDTTPQPTDPATLRAQAETVFSLLDGVIARPPAAGAAKAEMVRRAVYIHNTLWVAIELWQDDLLRRMRQSQGGFYVFSMTEDDSRAFRRRVVSGLMFVAEDIAALSRDYPALERLGPVADAVRGLAAGMDGYADANKAALRLALEYGFTPLNRRALPLPPLPERVRY